MCPTLDTMEDLSAVVMAAAAMIDRLPLDDHGERALDDHDYKGISAILRFIATEAGSRHERDLDDLLRIKNPEAYTASEVNRRHYHNERDRLLEANGLLY